MHINNDTTRRAVSSFQVVLLKTTRVENEAFNGFLLSRSVMLYYMFNWKWQYLKWTNLKNLTVKLKFMTVSPESATSLHYTAVNSNKFWSRRAKSATPNTTIIFNIFQDYIQSLERRKFTNLRKYKVNSVGLEMNQMIGILND